MRETENLTGGTTDEKTKFGSSPFDAYPYRLGMSVYRRAATAFFALGGLRRLRKKYGESGLDERMGTFDAGTPKNALWVHSVSVGEVQSALSLLRAAAEDSSALRLPRVLSTVTPTGRVMAEKLAGDIVDRLICSPWDAPTFVRSALDTLTPRAYVAMETERWPTMLYELRRRGIPAFLANGRLSEKSAARLLKTRAFWRGVLCCFDRLMVRFESDGEKFLSLGVPEEKIVVTGDCKIDAMLERRDGIDSARWQALKGDDGYPLFLAGSTHPGEEEIVLEAFRKVRRMCPEARLIIAPRHPERALSVVAAALPCGNVDLLSDHFPNGSSAGHLPAWDVLVADRIGVLFELYSIADAAFVGGSLVPHGGQNPMEPALFGIQVTHGTDMSDFPDALRLEAMGASRTVRDAGALADVWLRALSPAERERAREACRAFFETVGGGAARTWAVIRGVLEERRESK